MNTIRFYANNALFYHDKWIFKDIVLLLKFLVIFQHFLILNKIFDMNYKSGIQLLNCSENTICNAVHSASSRPMNFNPYQLNLAATTYHDLYITGCIQIGAINISEFRRAE